MKQAKSQTFGVTFVALIFITASYGESIQKRSLWFRAQTFEGEPFTTSQECDCHFRHVPPKDRQDFIEGDDQWIGHVFEEEKTGTVLEFCHVTLLWNKRYSNSLIVDGWVIKKFVVNDRKTLDDYLGKAPVQESQMSSTEMNQAAGDESTIGTMEPLDQDETSNDDVTESVTQLMGIILTESTVGKDLTTESNNMNVTEMETVDVSDSKESHETEKDTESIDYPSLESADEEQEGDEVIPDGEYDNQDTSEPNEIDDMVPIDSGIVPDLLEPTTASTLEYTSHEIEKDQNVYVSQDSELDPENTTEFDELEEISENPSPQADSDEPEEIGSDGMKVTTNLPYEELTKKELQPQTEQDETTTQIPDELKNPQGKTAQDVLQSDQSDPENSTIQLPPLANQTSRTVKPMVQEMEVTTMIPLPEFPITTAHVDEDTSTSESIGSEISEPEIV